MKYDCWGYLAPLGKYMRVELAYPQTTKFFKNILCGFFHQNDYFEHLRPKKFKKVFWRPVYWSAFWMLAIRDTLKTGFLTFQIFKSIKA